MKVNECAGSKHNRTPSPYGMLALALPVKEGIWTVRQQNLWFGKFVLPILKK